MHLYDLVDQDELADMLERQFVREQFHPTEPLAILSYTDKAMTFNLWNDVTKVCRGLIYNTDNGEIVARPFPKFFNHNQPESKTYLDNEPVIVTDKVDGSLGILYPLPSGGRAIATRGSFTSEQAIRATKIWNAKYSGKFNPEEGTTVLFEIIYPENRIVVDYDGMEDLVLLGGVYIDDGSPLPFFGYLGKSGTQWPGPVVEVFDFNSLTEALAAPPRPGKEGLVVHFRHTDTRVKIKQDDYLALHKIVTGLNEHVVWGHLSASYDIQELLNGLPDEFHAWTRDVAERMADDYEYWNETVIDLFDELDCDGLTEGPRKDFADAIKDENVYVKHALFLKLDNRPYSETLWKAVEPKKNTFAR